MVDSFEFKKCKYALRVMYCDCNFWYCYLLKIQYNFKIKFIASPFRKYTIYPLNFNLIHTFCAYILSNQQFVMYKLCFFFFWNIRHSIFYSMGQDQTELSV